MTGERGTSPLLSSRPATFQDGDAELEQFVLDDGGKHDEELCNLLYRCQIRHKATLGRLGRRWLRTTRVSRSHG